MESMSMFVYSMTEAPEHTQICALARESSTPYASHDIYCFCYWPQLPGLAVFRPPDGFSDGQDDVLRKMLGDNPFHFGFGLHQDLRSAHRAAVFLASCLPFVQDVE
ncbi:hypothetical protein MTO96_040687 [Rhipicephalus appendiculatus]